MSRNISSIENERIKQINSLMDDLYDHLPFIYESFMEKDIPEAQIHIKSLMKELKRLRDSMEDDL